ncbi:MAG: cytochrome C biogenesis protein [Micrococcales bacterium]|nr:cytochrome C biogenesis protein [Micrococcales bacterium]
MLEVVGAVVAGVLTVLAPCVLPLLPVVVGGAVAAEPGGGGVAVTTRRQVRAPLVITASLGVSIIVFTLLLKATTALIGIPPQVWEWLSGLILIGLGLVFAFPSWWERISVALRLQSRAGTRLAAARQRDGVAGWVLTGAALGPVFTSCSPLYGYVVVTVLPAEPAYGMLLLLAYTAGLCAMLLAIALLGQRAVVRLRWAADPHGWLRRGLGLVFVGIGVLVLTGWMKDIETWLIANAPVQPWNLDRGFLPE